MSKHQNICLLGASGSIGQNTLEVIRQHPQQYSIIALSGHQQDDRIYQQCIEFKPRYVVMVDNESAQRLTAKLKNTALETQVLSGKTALIDIATLPEVDCVIAAIVGAAGLPSCLAAAQTGKRILLANKEALVMAGSLFIQTLEKHNATLIPIDSEHNAILQCLDNTQNRQNVNDQKVRRITLTASGGPFWQTPLEDFTHITVEQACAHPTWSMGQKISIDSATMMNKGLEVIEAAYLFNLASEQIDVVIHPQSTIHAMVEYTDGSVISQMGQADMRIPIAYALAWPKRLTVQNPRLDITQCTLTFFKPDDVRFPCLNLAYHALNSGNSACCILNAANEVAVEAFLNAQIPFTAISTLIEETLNHVNTMPMQTLEAVLACDTEARIQAKQQLHKLQKTPRHYSVPLS